MLVSTSLFQVVCMEMVGVDSAVNRVTVVAFGASCVASILKIFLAARSRGIFSSVLCLESIVFFSFVFKVFLGTRKIHSSFRGKVQIWWNI